MQHLQMTDVPGQEQDQGRAGGELALAQGRKSFLIIPMD